MQMLLAKGLAHANPGPVREYAIHLLSQLMSNSLLFRQRKKKPPRPATWSSRLSERELEVLRLLRTDLNGPEIARELMVSLSTVRTHTQNIYAKLGVNNRRAAVRRAEELDLL